MKRKIRVPMTEENFYKINAIKHHNPGLTCAEIGKMFSDNIGGGYCESTVSRVLNAQSYDEYRLIVKSAAGGKAIKKNNQNEHKEQDFAIEFSTINNKLGEIADTLSRTVQLLTIPDDDYNKDMSVAKKVNGLCAGIGSLRKVCAEGFNETRKLLESVLEVGSETTVVMHNQVGIVKTLTESVTTLLSEQKRTNQLLESLLNVWTEPNERKEENEPCENDDDDDDICKIFESKREWR